MTEHYEVFNNIFNKYKLITELRTVSDIYIKEFSMFLSICLNEKLPLEYPFYEFEKIVEIIQNIKELHNILYEIFNKKLTFNKVYDKNTQIFFYDFMKKYFFHESQCSSIKNVSIKFKMNFNIFEEANISNLSELQDLINIMKTKHNINSNCLKFYKDKKEIENNKKLIEYDIDDDDIITVVINHSS